MEQLKKIFPSRVTVAKTEIIGQRMLDFDSLIELEQISKQLHTT